MSVALLFLLLALITFIAAAAGATLRSINLVALGLTFYVSSILVEAI